MEVIHTNPTAETKFKLVFRNNTEIIGINSFLKQITGSLNHGAGVSNKLRRGF